MVSFFFRALTATNLTFSTNFSQGVRWWKMPTWWHKQCRRKRISLLQQYHIRGGKNNQENYFLRWQYIVTNNFRRNNMYLLPFSILQWLIVVLKEKVLFATTANRRKGSIYKSLANSPFYFFLPRPILSL